jgi:hypothetical protein
VPASEVFQRWRRRLRAGRDTTRETTESDVADAQQQATGRYYGGPGTGTDDGSSDRDAAASTTRPGRNGPFVGRVAGQDSGYPEQTGAEQRAEASVESGGAEHEQ